MTNEHHLLSTQALLRGYFFDPITEREIIWKVKMSIASNCKEHTSSNVLRCLLGFNFAYRDRRILNS